MPRVEGQDPIPSESGVNFASGMNNSRLRAAVVLSWLLLEGCAPSVVWVKAGATEAEVARDEEACGRQARYIAMIGRRMYRTIDTQRFAHCLEAHGYTPTAVAGAR